jgi:hypothetical protein
MGEKSTSIERQPDRDERRSQAGSGAAASQPTMDLSTTLSALGNERVQRMLRERDLGVRPPQPAGARLQRQEEPKDEVWDKVEEEEEGPKEIPPEVAGAGIAAEVLLQQALATLQTKNRDDLPAAVAMLDGAVAVIGAVSATIEGLDNPLLMNQYWGFKQSILTDVAIVRPHAGVAVPLEKAETHLETASMAFASDFIAGAQGGG